MTTPPLTAAEYEVTRKCNFNCVHCYHDPARRGESELELDEVLLLLDDLAGAGVLHLTLTGGEPFAREDFPAILEAARARRFAPCILTNGSFLDADTVQWLARVKVQRLVVTVPGVSEETFGAVTGNARVVNDVLAGIERAKSAKLPVEVQVPLLRENFGELDAFSRLGGELGVPVKISPRLSPREGGSLAPLEHEIPEEELARFVSMLGVSCRRPSAGAPEALCPVGRESIAVSASGGFMPCFTWRTHLGTAPRDKAAEVWNSSETLIRLRSITRLDYEKCAACELYDSCHLCPGVGAVLSDSPVPGAADPIAGRHVHN
ncbi:MAG: radical SAM protein [Planctomycetota bacterium]|nr:MAG: radical SAM protein [Planctomycetota bacterium]